jgi:hypothetical protein
MIIVIITEYCWLFYTRGNRLEREEGPPKCYTLGATTRLNPALVGSKTGKDYLLAELLTTAHSCSRCGLVAA